MSISQYFSSFDSLMTYLKNDFVEYCVCNGASYTISHRGNKFILTKERFI